MNDWRFLKARPGKAHLWAPTAGGWQRSRCGRLCVYELLSATVPLAVENGLILKCRPCIPHEIRRKETA